MSRFRQDVKDRAFMDIAIAISNLSTCIRRKVGCVLVDGNDEILSMGYNGVPKDMAHCIDHQCLGANRKSGEDLDLCIAIHAEANALMRCHDIRLIRKIYTTTFPCIQCTKLLANTACKTIIYRDAYPIKDENQIIYGNFFYKQLR